MVTREVIILLEKSYPQVKDISLTVTELKRFIHVPDYVELYLHSPTKLSLCGAQVSTGTTLFYSPASKHTIVHRR